MRKFRLFLVVIFLVLLLGCLSCKPVNEPDVLIYTSVIGTYHRNFANVPSENNEDGNYSVYYWHEFFDPRASGYIDRATDRSNPMHEIQSNYYETDEPMRVFVQIPGTQWENTVHRSKVNDFRLSEELAQTTDGVGMRSIDPNYEVVIISIDREWVKWKIVPKR